MNKKSEWTGWHTFGLLIIVVAIILIGLLIPFHARIWTWILTMILLFTFSLVAGQGLTGVWRGLFIDESSRMSLSRFQMILWTVVILSGYITAALSNVHAGQANPVSIAIPSELWLLMGISTTSLAASPIIKSYKKGKPAQTFETDQTFSLIAKQKGVTLKEIKMKIDNRGQIVVNKNIDDAEWSDLFKGEETGNAAHLDLSKIQMFYFTIIVVIAYAAAVGTVFIDNTIIKIGELPDLSQGIVALIGISHAGYLTHKASPHSQTH